ncbi:MAG: hypothetical protein ACOYI8_08265 [Christensenellales bacterium]|jgi:hypothetical protein
MQKKWESWALLASAMLLPVIAMMYLYQRNTQYLMFSQVIWATLAMMAISLIGFGALRLITRRAVGAFFGCLVAWVLFFAFPSISGKTKLVYAKKILLYGASSLVLIFAAAFLLRKVPSKIAGFALAMAAMLTLFNLFPSVRFALSQENVMYAGSDYKTEYLVDENTPSPNVYWIHTDGMLGFSAMQTYFGEEQAEFRKALSDRGFAVNEDAYLEVVHATAIAIPALMCPYFYDTQLKEEFVQFEETRKFSVDIDMLKRNLRYARTKNEMLEAFRAKGYETTVIGTIGTYFPLSVDRFYYLPNDTLYSIADDVEPCIVKLRDYTDEKYLNIVESYELVSLLTGLSDGYYDLLFRLSASGKLEIGLEKENLKYRPENLSDLMENAEGARYFSITMEELYDSVHRASDVPKLTVVMNMLAHTPFKLDENGEPNGTDGLSIGEYAGQHKYAAKVLLNMIDVILAEDPNAVIVLQSDHGLHQQQKDEIVSVFGEGSELDIWNRVLSAIRVPEKYQNEVLSHAEEEPLDIARWLVNSFVGGNYEYLGK